MILNAKRQVRQRRCSYEDINSKYTYVPYLLSLQISRTYSIRLRCRATLQNNLFF